MRWQWRFGGALVTAGVLFSSALPAQAATPRATTAAKPVNCARLKCIALTFDDGPSPYTPKLLDTLAKNGVKVTFFLVGEMAERRKSVVRRMAREGHEIATHTYSHPRLTDLDTDEIADEIQGGQEVVRKITGKRPKMVRPPYGLTDEHVQSVAQYLGLPLILWSASSRDWELRRADAIAKKTISLARRDGIVLMHDIVPGTVAAMPRILKVLKQRGYTIVTVTEARRGRLPGPGETWPAR
ncbi:polysaccharide deacetylase family protein [Spongiactinospora sp. TRM90649]|uniref:polysaccharide deacetylase family protein n=1 Tax=Spongiactinospora sp. TRM90649 TaxID=3031114 RepID=UPI0023F9B64A|nr:polysaccharide deacetylase family protein [Spongiactinospora sp. TRM90649]MDF5751413.1 polysaccharide deacetylase family protein [Spongiactinospora sp. TRM90649]